jgi:predicted phosphodiesterase
MKNSILFCGDTHGQHGHIFDAVRRFNPLAVVLLGDMEPETSLHLELAGITQEKLWFIHGNHDTDSQKSWLNIWGSELASRNLHGRVVELPNGVRLAGLGGVFRASVWDPRLSTEPCFRNRKEHAQATPRQDRWQDSVPLRHWSSIYPDEVNSLADLRADILVSHEAPGYHHHGFAILDTLAQSMGVRVSVHGHHHDRLDSSERWASQGFKSFGVGLRGITAIDVDGAATLILSGELDRERNFRQQYLEVFKDVGL